MARYHLKRRPIANTRTIENGIADQEQKLGLAGTHFAKMKYQQHEAGLEMEPTGEGEEREAKEQLEAVSGGGDDGGGLQLEEV